MKNKQTVVEWLYERLERMIPRTSLYNMDKEQYFKQAKEMELAQRIDDYNNGHIDRNNNRFKLPKLNQNETND